MKKILILFLLAGFLWVGLQPLLSQEEKEATKKEIDFEQLKKVSLTYDPAGRRDPFKDLLPGREVAEETAAPSGINQMSINDANLLGIVKVKGKLTAIIGSPQGFPFYAQVGQKLADGSIISIQETKVTFRKTKQRGIRLFKPKTIVKELYPEER